MIMTGHRPVVIINEQFAERHWPNEDPLGKRIDVGDDGPNPREIVGVVKALKQNQWTAEPNLEMYLPHLQSPAPRALTLVVRSDGDPLALVAGIENQVWSIDKNLPVSDITDYGESSRSRSNSSVSICSSGPVCFCGFGARAGWDLWRDERISCMHARTRSASGWLSARELRTCFAWWFGREWRWL